MTWLASAHLAAWAMAVSGVLHFAAGFGLGMVYFRGVWWNARLFASGGRVTAAIALGLGRFILLGGLLALAALEGALPLLAMALGVLVARPLVMRRVREAAP
ncbi:MAG: ATP synthase subunit I [Roseiarcus sp.]